MRLLITVSLVASFIMAAVLMLGMCSHPTLRASTAQAASITIWFLLSAAGLMAHITS